MQIDRGYVMCSPSTSTEIVCHVTKPSGNRVKKKMPIVIDSGFICLCKKQKVEFNFFIFESVKPHFSHHTVI